LKEKIKNPLLISALHHSNIEPLKQEILKKLENYTQASFTVPLTTQTMPFMSWVHSRTEVQKVNFTDNSVQVVFEATPAFVENVKKRVEELNGKFEPSHTAKQE
jgi:GTP-binding protein HflX